MRRILLGAAEASLDIAGTAVLPGAWPILKGALTPVLERLKERLGGEDPTASKEKAEQAAAAFEEDKHLQELLRTRLLTDLDRLAASGERIQDDVQKLMLVVAGNQDLLTQLAGGVARVEQHLDEGVHLSDEAIAKLTRAITTQAERSRQVKRLALRELGPVEPLIRRQVHRLQVRAVELLQEGALDRAVDEVREGVQLLAAMLTEAPTDTGLLLELGFLYKTVSQVLDEAGRPVEARQYGERGEEVFRFVAEAAGDDQETALTLANAVHGLGNVDHQRRDYARALEKYRQAVVLYPGHAYAWHDVFAANNEIARSGGAPNLDEMQLALDRLRETGEGRPGLGRAHIQDLERRLEQLREAATTSDF